MNETHRADAVGRTTASTGAAADALGVGRREASASGSGAPYGSARLSAEEIHARTSRVWAWRWDRMWPLSGVCCGVCGGEVVVRYWQFHRRPGQPTIPWRCDVSVKCTDCAALQVHGVALTRQMWEARPRPTGIRAVLMAGSHFEPKIWKGVR